MGMMGGFGAHEYMAPCAAGENDVALSDAGYAANVEVASADAAAGGRAARALAAPEEVETPGATTVEAVCGLLGVPAGALIKAFPVLVEGRGPVLVVVRGDHRLNEIKLQNALGAPFRAAEAEEVASEFGAEPGFIGPVGAPVPVLADEALARPARASWRAATGRRAPDGRRARPRLRARVGRRPRAWRPGDRDPAGSPIRIEPAIEVGNIFKLGTRYSEPLGARYLDEDGKEQLIWMGSYGIGPARIVAAAVEQFADEQGISWPRAVAPFDVELVTLGKPGEEARSLADRLYDELRELGLDVLYDDRDDAQPGREVRRRRAARLPAARDDRQAERGVGRDRGAGAGAARRRDRCRSRAPRRRRRSCGGPPLTFRRLLGLDRSGGPPPETRRASRSTRGRSRTRSASSGSRWSRSSWPSALSSGDGRSRARVRAVRVHRVERLPRRHGRARHRPVQPPRRAARPAHRPAAGGLRA